MKSCYKSEKPKVLLRYRVHKNACLQGAGITIGFSFHHPSRITGTQKTTTKTLLPNASFKETLKWKLLSGNRHCLMLFSPLVFPYWWWWWCWPHVLILPCFTLRFDNLSYFSHPAKCNNQGPHWKCNICTQSSLHCTAEMIFTLLLVLKSGSCPSVHCWPSLYIDCCC